MLVPCEDGKEFIGNPFKLRQVSEMSPPQLLHLARDCLSSFLCSGVVVHAFGWLYQVDDLKEAMRSEAGWQVRYCLGLAL